MRRPVKAPGPTVDLAKPAFRFGIAEIAVGTAGHKLEVKVDAAQSAYPVRGKAQVTIRATLPDGQPSSDLKNLFAHIARVAHQPTGRSVHQCAVVSSGPRSQAQGL